MGRLAPLDSYALCVPRMGIEDDQAAAIGTKIVRSLKFFYSREMKVLLTLKVSMRVASRKGFRREAESEVSGTAKVGLYEQEPHRRHGWVVEVAQHTEGRTY